MRYGIDASNLVSGGGTNHLINLLSHMNGVTDNTMSIIIWASDNLRAEIAGTKGIEVIRFNNESQPKTIIDVIGSFDQYITFGIGNIVGWGTSFMEELRDFNA